MAELLTSFTSALAEFESLTDKKATTLKNKGKEGGIGKLKLLFKSGRTLDQRFADFDASVKESERGGGAVDPKKLLDAILTSYQKLDDALKKNIADYSKQEKELGPEDKDVKAGCGVFVSRMESLRKQAKATVELRRSALATRGGQSQSLDAKLASDIKVAYLNMAKGIQETHALMTAFIAKPSEERIEATFGSATGPRSISAAVTHWKQMVVKKNSKLADKLGADPDTLLERIFDLTQRKPVDYWKQQFGYPKAGWELRASTVAKSCLDQLGNWARLAQHMKAAGE